ncbi:endolytic transglycosylase MltG [Clostridium sp. MB40-C1]|uniref:endolytic transglycosylase MltG n=1 Tax=Clostridium sp. MB40-C1 TaxID=3070996 RepID=UPI0027E0FCE5|nr:endolytic transglycosylase MltG [Clostridium sp. MB40-C1]WMJ82130.1 endolytic transglycosylase MltG [Clostridium sp. MB40-C1]
MNKKRIFSAVIIIVVALVLLILIKVKNDINHPFITKNNKVEFVVNKGESLFYVIDKLNKDGLMKNKQLMKIYIKNNKLNTTIKSGEYVIPSDISIKEFVDTLNKGMKISVTIPEGYDVERIGDLLEKKGLVSKKDFLKSCKEYKLPENIKANIKAKYPLEGYLFPDTYEFDKSFSSNKIISAMLNRFEEVLKEVEKEENKEITNLKDIVIIASIVEKEARIDEDRAEIASVVFNRLKRKMMLQIDATVLYALGEHKDRLYLKDLKVNSPYNTYKIKGLPVGPICSPGKPSIKAALNPKNTENIYYVLQDNEKHYFTNNYKDFLKAKERYKKQFK